MQQDNVQRRQSLSNVISNKVKIFLCEYIWMNLNFSVTWSHNSACICSRI